MRSLPSIFKYYNLGENIKAYHPFHFGEKKQDSDVPEDKTNENKEEEVMPQKMEFAEFSLEQEPVEQMDEVVKESEPQEEVAQLSEEEEAENKEASEIILDAQKRAQAILLEAEEKAKAILELSQQEAELMKAEAQKNGYDIGFQEGQTQAYEDYEKKLEQQCQEFLKEYERVITETEEKKAELFQKYRNDLKDLSISVAEKVIQVSLRSCGDVIEKMIVSATDKLKSKTWAKIYIAKCDASLMVEGDSDLMRQISHISDHIKIVVMENESPGTCIIEFPDEIIDASASTQLENIKEILCNASL